MVVSKKRIFAEIEINVSYIAQVALRKTFLLNFSRIHRKVVESESARVNRQKNALRCQSIARAPR